MRCLVLSRQVVGILGSELRNEVHTGDVDLGAVSSIYIGTMKVSCDCLRGVCIVGRKPRIEP